MRQLASPSSRSLFESSSEFEARRQLLLAPGLRRSAAREQPLPHAAECCWPNADKQPSAFSGLRD